MVTYLFDENVVDCISVILFPLMSNFFISWLCDSNSGSKVSKRFFPKFNSFCKTNNLLLLTRRNIINKKLQRFKTYQML